MTSTQLAASTFPASSAAVVVIVAALALGAALVVYAVRDRSTPRWALIALGVLELALLAMTAWLIVAWVGGTPPAEPTVFVFYLLATLALPPAMAWWGSGEPGRWGSGAVAVACLVLVVLVLRVQQVWTGGVPAA